MSLRVQFKRGTSRQIENCVLDDGEIVINTNTKSIHVGDGTTLGGHEIPSKTEIENIVKNSVSISKSSEDLENGTYTVSQASNVITENPDVSILALQNDIWGYKADKDYAVGSFVIYNNDLYQCIVANGPASTVANPSNVVYWSQIPTLADLETLVVPTGTVLLYAGSVLPQGYLGCQGAPFDPITYEKLYNRIGTTYGGTAQSPLLPDFRDRYPIGAGTNALGTYISEQLPNISGSVGRLQGMANTNTLNANGAFSHDTVTHGQANSWGTAGNSFMISFNASSSNSTYTDNGKVYPLSLCLNYIIKT